MISDWTSTPNTLLPVKCPEYFRQNSLEWTFYRVIEQVDAHKFFPKFKQKRKGDGVKSGVHRILPTLPNSKVEVCIDYNDGKTAFLSFTTDRRWGGPVKAAPRNGTVFITQITGCEWDGVIECPQ